MCNQESEPESGWKPWSPKCHSLAWKSVTELPHGSNQERATVEQVLGLVRPEIMVFYLVRATMWYGAREMITRQVIRLRSGWKP